MNRPRERASRPALPAPQAMPSDWPPRDPPVVCGQKTTLPDLASALFKLLAALAHGKQLDSLLNFGQGDNAYILGLAVRGLKPALDAGIGAARPVVLRQNIRI